MFYFQSAELMTKPTPLAQESHGRISLDLRVGLLRPAGEVAQGSWKPRRPPRSAVGPVSVLDTPTFIKVFKLTLDSQFLENTTPVTERPLREGTHLKIRLDRWTVPRTHRYRDVPSSQV